MWSTVNIASHQWYDDTKILGLRIVRLGNSIKKDISRIVSISSRESWPEVILQVQEIKNRILAKLESISKLRVSKNTQLNSWEEQQQWNKILFAALARVHKHQNSPQFRYSLESLMEIDKADLSQTGVDFLLAYMKIVARIPESRIILPFKPS